MNHTLMDIASRSGVSTSTVSRVLSNSSHSVAEKTRQKVLQAAEELNYTPNAFARGLSKGEFRFIGLVVSDIRDPYFVEMARGVEDQASLRDYLVVYCNTDRAPEKERRYLEQLSALRAGVILAGGGFRREDHVRGLASHPAPVVTVGTNQLGCAAVRIDNSGGTLSAVDHLWGLGHRTIAFLGGPGSSTAAIERLAGFRDAMALHRLAVNESLVVESDYTLEGGSTSLSALLESPVRPTALFAANDQMALGAIREAKARGIRVPEELAVVGFNGIAAAEESDPPLTTVSLYPREMGRMAFDLLLQRQRRGEDPPSILVQGELIVRGSTVPSTAREPDQPVAAASRLLRVPTI